MFTNPFRPALRLAIGSLVLASCTKTTDPTPTTPSPTPGSGQADTVTGVVLDTQGQPVVGARVRADNNVVNGSIEARTDATGHYTLPGLVLGGWNIYAWKEATYKGKTYTLRMGMPTADDYNPFAPGSQGTVKNFQWQLTGEIPDRTRADNSGAGYFGGTIRFVTLDSDFNALPDGTTVTVTLTPVAGATLFDGRAPQVIKKQFVTEDASPAKYNYFLHDIPQCEYRITAENSYNGVTKPLALSADTSQPYTAALASYYFRPDGSNGSYESGLASPADYPVYLRLP